MFATYQGGMTGAGATFVAADSDGNMYITGYAGPDFPVTPGVVGPSPNPYGNSFVAKFDPSGKLLYSTYLPDPRGTALLGLVLDASGNAYVSGFSSYNNPPLNYTCFVDKISPDGTSLLFADDLPAAGCYLTEDPAGDIVAWGQSLANVYPPLTLVIKLDANGNPTWWRTLAADFAYISGLAFDAAGDIYVAGRTTSSTFPVTPGAYQTTISQVSVSCPVDLGGFAPGNTDAFIAKLDPVGASVLAATYLGGDCNNLPHGISVAPDGSVCLLVTTDSGNFPVVAAFSNITSSAGFGTFITQFDAKLSNLLLSSPVGASASQSPVLFIDPSGTVYIGGYATFLAAIESQ